MRSREDPIPQRSERRKNPAGKLGNMNHQFALIAAGKERAQHGDRILETLVHIQPKLESSLAHPLRQRPDSLRITTRIIEHDESLNR